MRRSDIFKQCLLRKLLRVIDRPDHIREHFTYLFTADGSLILTRGRDHFLQRHAAGQRPSLGLDLGPLNVRLPAEYEAGQTAICVSKPLGVALHELCERTFRGRISLLPLPTDTPPEPPPTPCAPSDSARRAPESSGPLISGSEPELVMPEVLIPAWFGSLNPANREQLAMILEDKVRQSLYYFIRRDQDPVQPADADDITQRVMHALLEHVLPTQIVNYWRAYIRQMVWHEFLSLCHQQTTSATLFSVMDTAWQSSGMAGDRTLTSSLGSSDLPASRAALLQVVSEELLIRFLSEPNPLWAFATIARLVEFQTATQVRAWLAQAFDDQNVPRLPTIQAHLRDVRRQIECGLSSAND